ncbi:SpoIIE family protein phosphatase [Streptomyces sp. A7024]|uniref:protein-serine/threonine phosphatase n=1 Tax=Streptomyces coryli TaxID=1128680 RepID=A0A6G4TWM8_9ACTN|nr:SpoIIE family protein phosphatase [Streptomyces coryli]NGN64182.1 SpoIIE family protein phosphatase [Streptomyces coryli]
MHTSAALTALATGVWRWDAATDVVSVDAEAARLLGLPPRPAEVAREDVRSRLDALDWAQLAGVAELAHGGGSLAESRVRLPAPDGSVLRTLRVRLSISGPRPVRVAVGTVQEVLSSAPRAGDPPGLAREAFLLDAGSALAEATSTDQVLRVAGSLAMPGFAPGRLAVFRPEGGRLTLVGAHGEDAAAAPVDVPLDAETPATAVLASGRAIYLPGPDSYRARFPEAWAAADRHTMQSWAYLPLFDGDDVAGVWEAAFPGPAPFTADQRSVLTTVARMLARALVRTQVRDSERELAGGLQRSMAPPSLPDIPGLSVAARYAPGDGGLSIGGDWYDVIPLPSGRFALVIGDVEGHDVRAAELMSQLRVAIRAYAVEGHAPDAVLSRANRYLTGLNERPDAAGPDPRYATCFYLEADPGTGSLRMARAGHLDPAMVLADGTMLIHPTQGGIPLGIEPLDDYPVSRHILAPGETMLLCTDGLVENGGHDLYTGQARLQAAFHATAGAGVEAVADVVLASATGPDAYKNPGPHSARREDDIAFLLLRTSTPAGAPPAGAGRHTHMVVPQTEQQRISDARAQLRGMLHDWADPDQVDAAELALSEMIANVMMHTDSPATVSITVMGTPGTRTLSLRISDTDATLPHLKHPGELSASGRGMLLLDSLADDWGVQPQGDGKMTWGEFYERGAQ